MSTARTARMIDATIPNAWSLAERFRPYVRDDHPPMERPEIVEDMCRPLSAGLYPDCPLCGASIAVCPCDPDESGEALWLQFQTAKAS